MTAKTPQLLNLELAINTQETLKNIVAAISVVFGEQYFSLIMMLMVMMVNMMLMRREATQSKRRGAKQNNGQSIQSSEYHQNDP